MDGRVLKSSVKKQHLCPTVGAEGAWVEPFTATQTPALWLSPWLLPSDPQEGRQGKRCRAAADEKPFLKNEVKIEADLS